MIDIAARNLTDLPLDPYPRTPIFNLADETPRNAAEALLASGMLSVKEASSVRQAIKEWDTVERLLRRPATNDNLARVGRR